MCLAALKLTLSTPFVLIMVVSNVDVVGKALEWKHNAFFLRVIKNDTLITGMIHTDFLNNLVVLLDGGKVGVVLSAKSLLHEAFIKDLPLSADLHQTL